MGDGKLGAQPHYARAGIEPIEAIECWGLDFHLGNALKYIIRAGHKAEESRVKDLVKALWYLRRRAKHRASILPAYSEEAHADRYLSLDACLEAWKLPAGLHATVTLIWRAAVNGSREQVSFAADHLQQEIGPIAA